MTCKNFRSRFILAGQPWILLLLVLGWAHLAAGQHTVVVPLTRQATFDARYFLPFDTVSRPAHLPNNLRRYLIKHITFGGKLGPLPAQQYNFLIGRDTQGRVVFIPAATANSLDFRPKDQQVLPATFGTATPTPFRIRLQGARGPVILELLPEVYPESIKPMGFTSNYKNDLFLTLKLSSKVIGNLTVDGQPISIEAANTNVRKFLAYTDSTTKISLPGRSEDEAYQIGESFLANEKFVTLRHISPKGDSLTVHITDAKHAPPVYGNYAGLLFQPAALTDVQGKQVKLVGNERPLVLDFWGTWCGPCVALTPTLKALHQQYATKAEIVSIASDDPEKVKKYLTANAITWANVAIPQEQEVSFISKLGIEAYPTFVLIHKGKVQYRGTGAVGLKELTEKLAQIP